MEIFTPSGEVSPTARGLIEQTLLVEGVSYLSENELDRFFELVSQKSPLQRQFFLETRKTKPVWEASYFYKLDSFREKISEVYWGFNFLSHCYLHGQPKYMIPSLGMMNCFLKAKFGENAVELNPVLGLSTPYDLEENARANKRDIAIRFPDIFLPETADHVSAEGFNFSYHDFFHATIVSCAPLATRERFLQCVQIISSSNYEMSEYDETQLHYLYQRFIDMEFYLIKQHLVCKI